jgi:hypothetical protein
MTASVLEGRNSCDGEAEKKRDSVTAKLLINSIGVFLCSLVRDIPVRLFDTHIHKHTPLSEYYDVEIYREFTRNRTA